MHSRKVSHAMSARMPPVLAGGWLGMNDNLWCHNSRRGLATLYPATFYEDAGIFPGSAKVYAGGYVRVSTNVRCNQENGWLRVLKNGVQVTEWQITSSLWLQRSIVVAVAPGDIFQLQCKVDDIGSGTNFVQIDEYGSAVNFVSAAKLPQVVAWRWQ